jgi:hypothetical protein
MKNKCNLRLCMYIDSRHKAQIIQPKEEKGKATSVAWVVKYDGVRGTGRLASR